MPSPSIFYRFNTILDQSILFLDMSIRIWLEGNIYYQKYAFKLELVGHY